MAWYLVHNRDDFTLITITLSWFLIIFLIIIKQKVKFKYTKEKSQYKKYAS
jgi:hypothetical protein